MKTGGEKNKDLHAHVHMKTKQNKTKTLTCPHNVQESSYPYIYCRLFFVCPWERKEKKKSCNNYFQDTNFALLREREKNH